jgi:hypothetical protein
MMYTFGLTLCFLLAFFGLSAAGFTWLMDGVIEEDEEQDYGKE